MKRIGIIWGLICSLCLMLAACNETNQIDAEKVEYYLTGWYSVSNQIEEKDRQMNAGEYLILGDEGYVEVFEREEERGNLLQITKRKYQNSHYIVVEEGQILSFSGKCYPIEKAPLLMPNEEYFFKPGMYKVGRDMLEGDYELIAEENASGSAFVFKDSTPSSFERVIASYEISSEADNKKISLLDGQYIILFSCWLKEY